DSDTIAITVISVNDPPTVDPIATPLITVNEDAGLIQRNSFLTGLSGGPANEGQTLTARFTITGITSSWTSAQFFTTAPRIVFDTLTPTGRLEFQAAQDVNGSVTYDLQVIDSDGLASVTRTFRIDVTAVNDKPVFTLDPLVVPISILEDAGLGDFRIVSSFAAARNTAIDEVGGQTPLTWILGTPVVTSGNLAFDSITMLADGTLRFRSGQDTAGTATVSLQLRDGGSAIAPNDNLSLVQSFQIIVTNVNDSPVASTGNYVIDAGESLTLNASATTDPDVPLGDVLTYAWDLNGDGIYETSTGTNSTATLTWAQLLAAGVTAPAVYNARLRVTDTALASSIRAFSLRTLIVDYGDAPDSYLTTKSVAGAAHVLNGDLWLGAGVTGDFDGKPSAAANLDTDDGVVFTSLFERTSGVSLPTTMNVTASSPGRLDAWLDLNRNGIFEASEYSSYDVVSGLNALSVMIPPSASLGLTYMRFRISTSGNLQPTGRVTGGEVEDYAVTITQLPTPQTPVIIKPVDFNLTDGLIPLTTDLTPRIEWQNNGNNHHFTVIVRNSAGATVFPQSNVAANQLDVTTTLGAGNYTVSVTAFDRAGVSAPTANYGFTVVPIAVSAPVGDVLTHRPIVSWNAVAGSKSYTVEITSIRSNTVVHSISLTAGSGFLPNYGVPTNLALGPHTVRVRAVDAADLPGDWSLPSAFNVRTPTTITSPTGTLLNLRPTLTWNPIFSATSYQIVLNDLTDGIEVFRVSGISSANWTPPANLNMADYSATVRGFNATGDGSIFSVAQLFTLKQIPAAIAPTGRVGIITPTFLWPRIQGSDSFELIINRGYGDKGVQFSSIIPASDSYTLTSALPLGNYSYMFREINFPANGSTGTQVSTVFSAPQTFLVTAAPVTTSLSPKSDPRFDWVTFDNRPIFTWANPPGAEKSDIWIAQTDNPAGVPLVVRGVSGTSFSPTTDLGIGTYTIQVRTFSNTDDPLTAADERIGSDWSRVRQFKISTPAALGALGRVATSRPQFTWSNVPGSITYDLWIASDSEGISPIIRIPAVAGLNYTPT
ncbi:MAG: GEVED domain-containing protein, partial [Planctomycetota bacterium]|nr:GEVED domain-containing protein [Planctomycetota bacterium]